MKLQINQLRILRMCIATFVFCISWTIAQSQIVDATKNKLMNKSWYFFNESGNVLIKSSDATNIELTNNTYDPTSQFIVEEADEDQNGSWFHIRHRASNKYLTVPSQSVNTAIILEELLDDGTNHNQQFKLLPGGTLTRKKIRSRLSSFGNNLNLQISATALTLIVNNPNANANQSFSFTQSEPNNSTERYSIVGANKGHFVNDLGYKTEQQGVVHTVDSDYSAIWNFEDAGSGYYYIRNLLTRNYITAYQSNANGAQMKMTSSPDEYSKWELVQNTNGQWRIKNKASGLFFSTKGENQDSDPLYQAGLNSSGVSWFIIPLGEDELEVLPGNLTELQTEVPFEDNPLNLQIYRPLLVSIGLPNNTSFRPAVWNALVWYYQSSEKAERALKNYNMLDNGHRAEMALAVRQYITNYLPTIPRSDWCAGEEAMVSWLENKVKTLRVDSAQRKVNAWEDFEQLPFYGATLIDLLYQNDLSDFVAPPNYLMASEQENTLLSYAQMAKQQNLQDPALIASGLTSSVIVGTGIVSGVVLTGVLTGAMAGNISIKVPAWAAGLAIQKLLGNGATVGGSVASSIGGPTTIVTTAALILTMQVMDVLDYIEFEGRIYAKLSQAQNEVIDLHTLYNSDYILGQVNLGRDLDYIFGAFSMNATINSGIANPDGQDFLPTVNCSANSVFETALNACEVTIPTTAEISSCYHFDDEFPYAVGDFISSQSVGDHTLNFYSPLGFLLCSKSITVSDNPDNHPTVTNCPSPINSTTFVASACSVAVYWSEPNFTDCQNLTISSNFESGDDFPVGVTNVLYEATDESGNSVTCSFLVTVTELNPTPPTALCKPDFSVVLDEYGESELGDITPLDIDNGSFDNCSDVTFEIEPSPFLSNGVDCSNISVPKVFTLKVMDSSGSLSTCTTSITAVDTIAPYAECQNQTLVLHQFTGTATLNESQVGGNSYSLDDCETISLSLSKTEFDCTDLGSQQVTLTATDDAGNQSQCTATVNVVDFAAPIITCVINKTIYLDATGQATVVPSSLVLFGEDNCGSSLNYQLTKETFTCADLGLNDETLTVSDLSGNGSVCQVIINVLDEIEPTALCQPVTVYLNSNGSAILNAEEVDNGSFDNCDTESLTKSVSPNTFSCSNLGENQVTLTVNDGSGNISTCNTTITIEDNTAPVYDLANLPDAIGECELTVVAPTASDNCAGSITASTTDPLTYTTQGTFTINWDYDDGNGNNASQTQTVIIADNTDPVPDLANLPDAIGECELTVVAPTASDNCAGSITASTTDPLTYTTQGTYTINWNYDDGNGNNTSQTQTVIIADNTDPVPDLVNLPDAIGECELTVVAPTASDNCAGSITASTTDPLTYTTQGTYTINWNYDDGNGNNTSQTQTVIVADVSPPNPVCQSYSLQLDAAGNGSIVVADIENGSSDNCANAADLIFSLSQTNFDCSHVGVNPVTLTVDDNNGNTNTCTAMVTVFGTDADGDGYSLCEGDTVDDDPTTFPGADELCDGIDNDLDGSVDEPHGLSTEYEWIESIELNDLNNVSGDNGGYADFSSTLNATLATGESFAMTLTPGFSGGSYPEKWRVYIDWNQNGIFEHPSEKVLQRGGMGTKTGNIDVPSNAPIGTTKIRVIMSYGTPKLPCDDDFEGEVEDYTVTINLCDNITDGGTIGGDEILCPANDDPALIGSLTSPSGGSGIIEYIWLENTTNAAPPTANNMNGWLEIEGANADSYDPGPINQSTWYLRSSRKNGCNQYVGESNVIEKMFNSDCSPYCDAKGLSTQYEWIKKVKLKDINNTSGDDGGYGNYTNLMTSLQQGESKNIVLKPGFSGGSYQEYWRVWVDWNQDGDFDDTGEKEVQAKSYGNLTKTISVPSNALLGNTRMRVAMKYGGFPNPCETFDEGEVEDYTITVTNGSNPLVGQQSEDFLFKVHKNGRSAILYWVINTDYKTDYFLMEHSTDGQNFETKDTILSISESTDYMNYQWEDHRTKAETNYYRIKSFFGDGTFQYSSIKEVTFPIELEEVTLFPNPANKTVFIHMKPFEGLDANIQLINSLGKVVLQKEINEIAPTAYAFDISDFKAGIYWMNIKVDGKKSITKPFVVSN